MSERAPRNGHTPENDMNDLDILSPAIETLHTRLLDDGFAFRADLPDVSAITRSALLLIDPREHDAAGDEPESVLEISREAISRATLPVHPRQHRHTQRFAALAAALAIVGLLAALFATLAPRRTANGPIHPSPAGTELAGEEWTKVGIPVLPHALDPNSGNYIAAPGDPSVVYYIDIRVDSATGYAEEQLSRLDGGQRWVSLSFPLPDIAGAPASVNEQKSIAYRLDVMPSDPMALILSLDVLGTATCPIANPLRYTCDEYLYSSDGGAHWGPLHLPGLGMLALWNALDSDAMTQPYWNQDGVLYTTLSSPDPGYHPTGIHLVSSMDNGATWHYADATLSAGGQPITEYVPAPHGTTMYAVTAATSYDVVSRQLWRSNDAGAHWTRTGPMPGQTQLIGIATPVDGTLPLVYRDQRIDQSQLPPNSPANQNMLTSPEVSRDGGATWQYMPLTGLPTDTGGTPYTVGTLADGSLVVVLPGKAWEQSGSNAAANLTFYAWKPWSSSWRQLTPTITNIQIGNTATPSWWLISDTPASPARLCVSGQGGIIGTNWGIACSTLS